MSASPSTPDVSLRRSEPTLRANSRHQAWLWFPKIRSGRVGAVSQNQGIIHSMLAIVHLLGTYLANLFKSRRRLEAENVFLRHQLNIALRRQPPRLRLRGSDRALLIWMTQLWPSLVGAAKVVQPQTIL